MSASTGSPSTTVRDVLATLKRRGTKRNRDGMARFAIVTDKAFGVSVGDLRRMAKQIGPSHDLAIALWDSGWHDARMLATMVDDPARLTPAQMDRWCRDFDNWGICDTACFHFFDRSPHAWRMVNVWATRKPEFEKRTAFALLASLALHDKQAPDARFTRGLRHIERAATDDRNFVRKGVSWALRSIGHRNARLHAAAVKLATRLSKSSNSTARWVGHDTLRDLMRPMVTRRFKAR
jgi:3-methyladenine DNA glycosylase AlkD